MSKCKQYYCYEILCYQVLYYQRRIENDIYFDWISEAEITVDWIDIIGIVYRNRSMKVINKLNIEVLYPQEIRNPLFNEMITELIWQNKALAVHNALVKNGIIGAY